MTTAAELIQLARYQLHDQDSDCYRWSDEELLDYLNAGMKEIINLVPEANVVEELFSTADGSPLQQIPAGGTKFIKATSNDNAGTKTGGIRYCEKDVLDTYDPDWYYTGASADPDRAFEHYMHDPRDPTRFYLYPRPSGAGVDLYIQYAKTPTVLSTKSATYPLRTQYERPIVEYMFFRAMTKEGRYSQSAEQQRERLWNNFLQTLGLGRRTAREVSPEQHRPPDSSAS